MVALYYSLGAHVYFGDWDEFKGKQVEQQLLAESTGGSVHFQKVDVRDYPSQLALFDVPFKVHGHVDVAVSCAAVKEPGGWFEPQDLNLDSVKKVGCRTSKVGTNHRVLTKHLGTRTPERAHRCQSHQCHVFQQDRSGLHESEQAPGGRHPLLEINLPGLVNSWYHRGTRPFCIFRRKARRHRSDARSPTVGACTVRCQGKRHLSVGNGHSAFEGSEEQMDQGEASDESTA